MGTTTPSIVNFMEAVRMAATAVRLTPTTLSPTRIDKLFPPMP